MRIALLTLSVQGFMVAKRIRTGFPEAHLYVHDSVVLPDSAEGLERFEKIAELTVRIFDRYEGVVYIAPCGVAVRAVAECLKHKKTDPAVVVLDAGARFAVSLLSGHEGGANALALQIANLIGAEPVISTTTEALKNVIVGVGCRKGAEAARLKNAITDSLKEACVGIEDVRLIATADVKADEPGLLQAVAELGIPLRIVSSEQIRTFGGAFSSSSLVMDSVNLPAVAEPAAMLAGRRTRLIRPKKSYHGVTVAIAREGFLS